MNWENLLSTTRFGLESLKEKQRESIEFQRDYDRLIFLHPLDDYKIKHRFFHYPEVFLFTID